MESCTGWVSLRTTAAASPWEAARPIFWVSSNSVTATPRSLTPISRTISAGNPATTNLTASATVYPPAKGRIYSPEANPTSPPGLLRQRDDRVPLGSADFLDGQPVPLLQQRHPLQLRLSPHLAQT